MIDDARLSPRQRELLAAWLPGARVVRDHSWGTIETTVLRVATAGHGDVVVKAGGETDHHLAREIAAHERWIPRLAADGLAPELLRADRDAKLVVTRWLDGELVLDTQAAVDPQLHRQAGALLARLHGAAPAVPSDDWDAAETAKAARSLAGEHRIPAEHVARLRAELASWRPLRVELVPTHGDWQPRNWLVHDGELRMIDFGRALERPAATDLVRLAFLDFARDPALERATLDGYGRDPRDAALWRRLLVREAIGTAVWAFAVGDGDFEAHGLRMISRVLAEAPSR